MTAVGVDDGVSRTGGCACGAIRFHAVGASTDVLQCHCENCRRLSGNFVAAIRVPTAGLDTTDRDRRLATHDLGYAEYGFCTGCGSTLYFRAADTPEITSVMVGTLDDASGLSIAAVWFAAEAQAHNTLPADVPKHADNG